MRAARNYRTGACLNEQHGSENRRARLSAPPGKSRSRSLDLDGRANQSRTRDAFRHMLERCAPAPAIRRSSMGVSYSMGITPSKTRDCFGRAGPGLGDTSGIRRLGMRRSRDEALSLSDRPAGRRVSNGTGRLSARDWRLRSRSGHNFFRFYHHALATMHVETFRRHCIISAKRYQASHGLCDAVELDPSALKVP